MLSGSPLNELEMELMAAGKKLQYLPSLREDIRRLLSKLKNILRKVEQKPSELMKNAPHPVIKALVAQELVTRTNLDLNISLSCCFCEILRICAPDSPYDDQQLKAFFEMVVLTFEKVSSASGRSYTEMGRVLEIFNRFVLSLLMLEQLLPSNGAGLKLRLFKQFLTVYGSNPAAIKLEMEKFMTAIIKESVELKLELVDSLVTLLRNTNQIASYDCSQAEEKEKALMNFAARFKQHIPETRIIKTECVETKPTCCQPFFYGPPKSVTEAKGKRKRDSSLLEKQVTTSADDGKVCVQGYEVKQSVAHILEAAFKKHGDIAANCIFKSSSMRSPILEVVCEVVKLVQTNEVLEKMEDIEHKVSDAEAVKIDVAWLRADLKAIYEKMGSLEKSNLVKKTAKGIVLIERAAQTDLKGMNAEVEAAREEVGRAEMLVEELKIAAKDLNDKVLECKAKVDSWV